MSIIVILALLLVCGAVVSLLRKGRFFKLFLVAVLLLIGMVALSLRYFITSENGKPVLRVVLTGNTKEELIEWKTPHFGLQKKTLTTYEVQLESLDGTLIGNYYVLGDQVAIKGKVLRFHPVFHFFGISNLCQFVTVYSGYEKGESYNSCPMTAYTLTTPNPCTSWLWKLWEPLFFQEETSCIVKSGLLQSQYFPLKSRKGKPFYGNYQILLTESGLTTREELGY